MNTSDILKRLSELETYLRDTGDVTAAEEVYALAVSLASDSTRKQVYRDLIFS